jgi:lipoate-protein ligase B
MCRQVSCRRCGNATWSGCGQHVSQVMAGVPKSKRCQCPPKVSFVERIFGGRKSSV